MSSVGEMTIDQLAASVGMTVRNVRAYATRGLLPPPRLVGRKGFYGEAHASRLRLIRDLIGRGYTLGAVEKALEANPELPDGHAMDLLGLLADPVGQPTEAEVLELEVLSRLAGLQARPDVFAEFSAALAERGLVEVVDETTVRLLQPVLVRAGAQAIAIGLAPETVLALFADLRADMAGIAGRFVTAARAEVWRPFARRGMPEEEWETLISSIEGIIPVAVQAVLASFRHELTTAIQEAVAGELSSLTGEQIHQLFGPDE